MNYLSGLKIKSKKTGKIHAIIKGFLVFPLEIFALDYQFTFVESGLVGWMSSWIT